MKTPYKITLSIAIAAACGAVGLFFWQLDKSPTSTTANAALMMPTEATDSAVSIIPSVRTKVADLWQTSSPRANEAQPKTQTEASEFTSFGFSLDTIYQAIGEIEIEGSGLVIDKNTRHLLEQAWRQLGPELKETDLLELNQLLTQSLPEPLGQQAGEVLNNFYHYKTAESHYQQQNKDKGEHERLEQLAQLRRKHLGGAMANQFYGNEEALVRFYSQARELHQKGDLSDQQLAQHTDSLKADLASGYLHLGSSNSDAISSIKQRREQLTSQGASAEFIDQLEQQSITYLAAQKAITDPSKHKDFELRLAKFNHDQSNILNAALVESDKLQQIQQVAKTYFSESELQLAEHYQAVPQDQDY
jgi:hypothetical protein